ncbi:pseudouridine synthase [Hyphomonas adhaerens]|uniref:pseudouridine synthase n=1 Tax=Hyphomonas adhaerens TaxID=81029 RepID=UPI002354F8C1|nr:pseudouridine synthase [Hyphomonas adhaerens]|tara:strand:+ start:476 stop:1609 length:1134 start_codon:yes stop_codon:yes gene_type:complete
MTERRETGRPRRKPAGAKGKPGGKPGPGHKSPKARGPAAEPDWSEGERIAKYLARAGVASRREVERMIEEGKVSVDGKKLTSPAFKVTGRELIRVGRRTIAAPDTTRLWRYHKPSGLIATNSDPEGRRTIFDELPRSLPRVVTVGRLDLTTEGLLLLTNDGELARTLELPSSGLERTYRVRAKGTVTPQKIEELASGLTVEGVKYQPITAVLDREMGANSWLTVTLSEGKKREVRRALEAVNLIVNRLIRVSYGPFELADLKPGMVDEVPPDLVQQAIGHLHSATGTPAPPPRGAPAGSARTGSGRGRPDPRKGAKPASKSGPKAAGKPSARSRDGKRAKPNEEWTTQAKPPSPKSHLGTKPPSGKLSGSRKRNKPR